MLCSIKCSPGEKARTVMVPSFVMSLAASTIFLESCKEQPVHSGSSTAHSKIETVHSIFSVTNRDVLLPFTWGAITKGTAHDPQRLEDLTGDSANLHPLILGSTAFTLLLDGHENDDTLKLSQGKDLLDFLIQYPYLSEVEASVLFLYPFPFGDYPGMWWSGMANSVIALAFVTGYDIFREVEYWEWGLRSLAGSIRPIEENGSALDIAPDSRWYFEYVRDGLSVDNAKFVLNGFLLNLIVVKIFERITGDSYYEEAFVTGVNGLKHNSDRFYYPDMEWTYYMLNPLTIESVHYAIYDIMLYDALFILTNDVFFAQEARIRRGILKMEYPIMKLNDRHMFSLIGPPHPYWIDTYGIGIHFWSGGKVFRSGTAVNPKDMDIPILERAFILADNIGHFDSARIYSVYYGDSCWLYTVTPDEIDVIDKHVAVEKIPYGLSAMRQALIISNNLFLKCSQDTGLIRGTAVLTFDSPIDVKANKFFACLVNPGVAIESVLVSLVDVNESNTYRYYKPLHVDTLNLVLLNWMGFRNIGATDLSSVTKLYLDFYFNPGSADCLWKIDLSELFLIRDAYSLYEWVGSNSFFLNEETTH